MDKSYAPDEENKTTNVLGRSILVQLFSSSFSDAMDVSHRIMMNVNTK